MTHPTALSTLVRKDIAPTLMLVKIKIEYS